MKKNTLKDMIIYERARDEYKKEGNEMIGVVADKDQQIYISCLSALNGTSRSRTVKELIEESRKTSPSLGIFINRLADKANTVWKAYIASKQGTMTEFKKQMKFELDYHKIPEDVIEKVITKFSEIHATGK